MRITFFSSFFDSSLDSSFNRLSTECHGTKSHALEFTRGSKSAFG